MSAADQDFADELEPGGDPDAVPELEPTPADDAAPDEGDAGRPHV